jgi:hypothetical protein
VPAHTLWTHVQRQPWEQSFLTLFTVASRLQKQKARSNTYVAIFNFIGYFTLVLHDIFPFPVLCDLLHVQIPQVLSLWCAIPTSLMLYQDSGLVCFFLIFLSAKITYLSLLLSFITCNYQFEVLKPVLLWRQFLPPEDAAKNLTFWHLSAIGWCDLMSIRTSIAVHLEAKAWTLPNQTQIQRGKGGLLRSGAGL